jgi:hypothetical protein
MAKLRKEVNALLDMKALNKLEPYAGYDSVQAVNDAHFDVWSWLMDEMPGCPVTTTDATPGACVHTPTCANRNGP